MPDVQPLDPGIGVIGAWRHDPGRGELDWLRLRSVHGYARTYHRLREHVLVEGLEVFLGLPYLGQVEALIGRVRKVEEESLATGRQGQVPASERPLTPNRPQTLCYAQ